MVLVTLGIAPGFSVNTADLQKYLDSNAISKYETTGRQLILYLTTLAPNAKQVFEYTLQATPARQRRRRRGRSPAVLRTAEKTGRATAAKSMRVAAR